MPNQQTPRDLSKNVRDYFLSDEVFDQYDRIVSEMGLDVDEVIPSLSAFVYEFVSGVNTIDVLQERIEQEFFLDVVKAQELISSLFLHIVSPIAQEIPGIAQEIQQWGQQARVSGEKMSSVAFVRFFIDSLPETYRLVEQHRLEAILRSYLNGTRKQDETVAFLQRPQKLGGMEISEPSAREMVELLDAQKATVTLTDIDLEKAVLTNVSTPEEEQQETRQEPVVPQQKPEVLPKKNIQTEKIIVSPQVPVSTTVIREQMKSVQPPKRQPVSSVPSQKLSDTFSKEDEKEIQLVAQLRPSVLKEEVGLTPEQQVSRICEHEAFSFSDAQMQKRCHDIVNARVRDVRDVYQTRDALERSVEEGGLGLVGRRLVDMIEQIEKIVDEVKQAQQQKTLQEKTEFNIKKQEVQTQQKLLQEKESKLLSKQYVQTTGKAPTESIERVAPSRSRTSAALSQHTQLQQQESKIDTEKVRNVIEKSVTKKPLIQPSVMKPRVQDIQTVSRLSGPIEELKTMGLQEFRRLAKNPEQAMNRVKDVVNLLDEQGYAKRVDGLRALQASPLMRAYVIVTQKALLSGKSVDDILAEDPQGLTKTEYQILMKLNADLRF